AMSPDELQQPWVNGRPDGRLSVASGLRNARQIVKSTETCHVLDRDLNRELQELLRTSVDDRDRSIANRTTVRGELGCNAGSTARRDVGRGLFPGGPCGRLARRMCPLDTAQEAGDLVERPLSGREADALERTIGTRGETLQRERKMRPPLGWNQRVNLVHDDRIDRPQRPPPLPRHNNT